MNDKRSHTLWAVNRLLAAELELLEGLIEELREEHQIDLIPTIDLPRCYFAADAFMSGIPGRHTIARECPDVLTLVQNIRKNLPWFRDKMKREKATHDALMAFYFKAARIEGIINNSFEISPDVLNARLAEEAKQMARLVLPAQTAMGHTEGTNKP